MIRTVFFFLFILVPMANAAWRIQSLLPPHRVLLAPDEEDLNKIDATTLRPTQRMLIRSEITQEVTGYADVVELLPGEEPRALAEVILHERHALVAPGDPVEVVDFTSKVDNLPGRGDLFVNHHREISARYKRLAWFGLYMGDGHSLSKGETLIDFTTAISRGITDRFTLGTVAIADIVAPNLLAKYTVWDDNYLTITPSFIGWFSPQLGGSSLQGRILISTPVNTKVISHTAVSIARTSVAVTDVNVNNALLRTELQTGFEYLTDTWDRILFGPTYNFSIASVGGYLAYIFIWDHFHLGAGIHTQNFANLTFDAAKGYYASITAFWRF